ncbi:pleckstrin homology domain-containing family O member 1-like [Erpetoichthys calabaricus]|uniref:Pleckstrin homology domain containing, family O member 1b n=1 Tax=Erpetoichthys calabaricus TaxID=27687 RepID=A0A8C4X563_ERPCA|nr:pleckstrin homology domain-containing family O member 1-like [Erpetoichthys calabaricus]
MKKNNSVKRGPQDANQPSAQPEKIGWIRKYCGKGIFREIWKTRYVVLKGDHLYISEKEVKDEKKIQEVFDLSDYEKSEELRKSKRRSKKNHSKFTLLRSKQPGNTVPNLVFLAVSPEEKESWINALNGAITRAKNRIFDEVTVEEDSYLAHPTRDRAKIQHIRRPPTRGHLMAVASTSTSDGMLTLDLIQEEDSSSEDHGTCEQSFRVDLDKSVGKMASVRRRSDSESSKPLAQGSDASVAKLDGLLRKNEISWEKKQGESRPYTPQVVKKPCPTEKNRCASLEEILSQNDSGVHTGSTTTAPLKLLQELIDQKLERTQELLAEIKVQEHGRKGKAKDLPASKALDCESSRLEAERLLQEAASNWGQAKDVLEEVKELRALYRQMDLDKTQPLSPVRGKLKSPHQSHYRKSMM